MELKPASMSKTNYCPQVAKEFAINKAYKMLLAILIAHGSTVNSTMLAHGPVLHQNEDKRPRADKSWANTKRNVLEICVEHRSGIGKTEFVLDKGRWPANIRFVFRNFKALEGFKVHTASNKFDGAIAPCGKRATIALGQGFSATRRANSIYITAPNGFVYPEEKSISVEWIDFYRN